MRIPFKLASCFSSPRGVVDGITEETHDVMVSESFRVFSYAELKSATNGFHRSNKIGQGGFGSVYWGRLNDGSTVAVKVLSIELESMRGEREFKAEISAMSGIKHKNLVMLRGYGVEDANRFLVYEYMENNSIAQSILGEVHKRKKFDWDKRREIALGIARGLAYLHEEVKPYVLHRDIKAGNILLDRDFTPKVSDFGLSKLVRDDFTHISTRVAGTLGYLAPEYAISGRLTRKSDVYSYGVLLLEIISGRPVILFDFERCQEIHLAQMAWEAYKDGDIGRIIDPVLDVSHHEENVSLFIKVGLLCVQEATKNRPGMSTVVKLLTGEIEMGNVAVNRPGQIIDIADIRIKGKCSSRQSNTSKNAGRGHGIQEGGLVIGSTPRKGRVFLHNVNTRLFLM